MGTDANGEQWQNAQSAEKMTYPGSCINTSVFHKKTALTIGSAARGNFTAGLHQK
jgi:hypothetical protein